MKRLFVPAVAAVAFAVPSAQAAAPKSPTIAQFKALQAQVKKDEKKIATLENVLIFTITFALCQNAVTSDAFQATWQQDDAVATSLGKPAVYGAQTPISDLNACADLRIVRSHSVPHNTSVFSALAALLGSYSI